MSKPTARTKWIAAGILALLLLFLTRTLPLTTWIQELVEVVRKSGPAGYLLFVLAYIVGTICFFPGSLLTIAAGLLFGLWGGSVIASLGSMGGASICFLIARFVARDWVQRKLTDERFRSLDAAIGREGWKIVLLLRLSPLVPFNLLNYFIGLTRISFWSYFFASWVGMLPGTVLYVYFGHIGQSLNSERPRTPAEQALLVVGLAATLLLSIWLGRLAKKELQRHTNAAAN
ncbi:MAG: TVP38/TMEM64 family protein [Verrucomicrobiota bacterium]|nr:TVP38/TMEM64 family protein [Verrucomicrobiota bacterium]